MKRALLISILLILTINLQAQFKVFDETFKVFDDSTEQDCSYKSFNLGFANTGISFGNSYSHNGLRFNVSDCGIGNINGVNITLWEPDDSPGSVVNGFSFGLAPYADQLNGVSVGLGAVVAGKSMNGFNFGFLANVSEGEINGINIGGLALVAEKRISGFNFGGFALVSEGDIQGINLSGLASISQKGIYGINFGTLALVAQEEIYGVNISGLASVAQGNIFGFNFGGLALVSQKSISGINTGGLALVSQEQIRGINLGGLALVGQGGITGFNFGGLAIVSGAEDITGINITVGKLSAKADILGLSVTGYNVDAYSITGINFTAGWVKTEDLTGISASLLHKISGRQTGIAIGLINITETLTGIQLGLLNIVKDNPSGLKVLPFINFNF